MTEPNLLDILDEAEIDLINRLRGYTEEGAGIGDGWSVTLALRDGRWHVDHHHPGEAPAERSIGEGWTFSEAWVDQCMPELREGGSVASVAGGRPVGRPRLHLIRGGID